MLDIDRDVFDLRIHLNLALDCFHDKLGWNRNRKKTNCCFRLTKWSRAALFHMSISQATGPDGVDPSSAQRKISHEGELYTRVGIIMYSIDVYINSASSITLCQYNYCTTRQLAEMTSCMHRSSSVQWW